MIGVSLAAMAAPAWASAAADAAADAAASSAGDQSPSAPAARAERLNPTGRTIILTVPAKDGAAYRRIAEQFELL